MSINDYVFYVRFYIYYVFIYHVFHAFQFAIKLCYNSYLKIWCIKMYFLKRFICLYIKYSRVYVPCGPAGPDGPCGPTSPFDPKDKKGTFYTFTINCALYNYVSWH